MALKTSVFIEVEKNNNKYVFYMPFGTPLQECYDAATAIAKEIVDFSKLLEEQGKKRAEEDKNKKDKKNESVDDGGKK